MSREHNALRDLLAAAALGAATPAEALRVDAHARECAVCQEELDAFRATSEALALSVPQVNPPPGLRERVLTAARADRLDLTALTLESGPPPSPAGRSSLGRFLSGLSIRRPWPAIAAGLAALALLLVGWNLALQTSPGPAVEREVTAINFRGAGAGAAIRGEALVIPGQGTAVLRLSHLPALDEGQVYQLWSIDGDNRKSWAGTVTSSLPGEGVVATADLAGVRLLAITPETAANRVAPTVRPWVVVSLPQQG